MNRKLNLLAAMTLALVGCSHAQIPQPVHSAALSWGASSGTTTNSITVACTTSGVDECTYVMGRYTLTTADAGKCPLVNMTTPNYTPLNSANPTNALTYVDTTSAGTTACYEVQAVQFGNPSGASNVAGPLTILPNTYPSAPALSNGVVASQPTLPSPNSATKAPTLTARIQ